MIRSYINDAPRALLIQDVHELRAEFRLLWQEMADYDIDEHEVLEWIIANWLRERHHLLVWDHNPHSPTMHAIKNFLREFTAFPLNQLLEKYIIAPVLYKGCRDITLDLRGVDLYLWYFK
jgi:hypothetical protein